MKYLKTYESIHPSSPDYGDNFNKIMKARKKESILRTKNRREEIFNKINNFKVGEIISEHIIYSYVQELHNEEDFVDGDISERIEEYPDYKLQLIKLDDIELDEWELDEELALEYGEKFKNTNYCPPLVIDDSKPHTIIDGNHRGNGLRMVGEEYVKAFVGIKNVV